MQQSKTSSGNCAKTSKALPQINKGVHPVLFRYCMNVSEIAVWAVSSISPIIKQKAPRGGFYQLTTFLPLNLYDSPALSPARSPAQDRATRCRSLEPALSWLYGAVLV